MLHHELRCASARCVVAMVEHEWPQNWPELFDHLEEVSSFCFASNDFGALSVLSNLKLGFIFIIFGAKIFIIIVIINIIITIIIAIIIVVIIIFNYYNDNFIFWNLDLEVGQNVVCDELAVVKIISGGIGFSSTCPHTICRITVSY